MNKNWLIIALVLASMACCVFGQSRPSIEIDPGYDAGALRLDGSKPMTGTLNAINASFSGNIHTPGTIAAGTGTASLPSLLLGHGSDPDTGLYSTTGNEIRFAVGGTQVLRVQRSGSSNAVITNGPITTADGNTHCPQIQNAQSITSAVQTSYSWAGRSNSGLGAPTAYQPCMIASGVVAQTWRLTETQFHVPITMCGASQAIYIGSSTQYFLSRSTGTAASGTELFRDGNTASSRVPAINNNGVMSYDGTVVAIASDSYAGKWKISGAYMVSAASGTAKLTTSDVLEEHTQPAWAAATVRPVVVVSGGQLYFYASGPANVSWSCDLKCVYSKW